MATFVKLDSGILNSTLWFDRDSRDVFITALLMAEPWECKEPVPQCEVGSLELTGWEVPPGWYGFVPAAGPGIVHRAGVDQQLGMAALARMGQPERESRTQEFDGRRMVRVDGGYLILNYIKYRERDYTSALRSKLYRDRMRAKNENGDTRDDDCDTCDAAMGMLETESVTRDITQEEEDPDQRERDPDLSLNLLLEAQTRTPAKSKKRAHEYQAEFLAFWEAYPRKTGKGGAFTSWERQGPPLKIVLAAIAWQRRTPDWLKDGGQFIPHPATWLNRRQWEDEPPAMLPFVPGKTLKVATAVQEWITQNGENADAKASGHREICDGRIQAVADIRPGDLGHADRALLGRAVGFED